MQIVGSKPLVTLVASACALFSGVTYASNELPRYFYADLAAGALDDDLGTNSNVTAMSVGGVMPLSIGLLASLDYSARFIHPEDITAETYTLLPGLGMQTTLTHNLSIIGLVKAGMQWAEQTNDKTNTRISNNDEFTWGAELGVIYQLNDRWTAIADVEWNRSDILDVDIYSLKADYRISSKVSLGGFYTHRNSGVATTNEGGASLKLYF